MSQLKTDQYIIFKFNKNGNLLPNNIRFGGFTISDEKIIEADGKIFFTGKSKTIESGIGIINFTNNNMTVEFYEIK